MNLNIKKIVQFIAIPLAILAFQSVQAQPIMIPGFMGIESSSLDAAAEGSDSTTAYFTISNLHHEPIILLSASAEAFENANFIGPNNEELEQVIIQPGDRLIMGSNDVHLRLSGFDASINDERSQAITLLVRRGLEPEEEVEAIEDMGAMSGRRSREAGIPNEKEYIVNVPVRH